MGRKVDADVLVGSHEIAERLGLTSPEAVYSWRRRHADFPQPITRLRIGFVWAWPDVEAWARKTGRLKASD
ncbi:MAG: DNA-binding protein [Actinomycetota bacterium]|nr:DNA-binding protein [Actinomycetota bacterium]